MTDAEKIKILTEALKFYSIPIIEGFYREYNIAQHHKKAEEALKITEAFDKNSQEMERKKKLPKELNEEYRRLFIDLQIKADIYQSTLEAKKATLRFPFSVIHNVNFEYALVDYAKAKNYVDGFKKALEMAGYDLEGVLS